MKLLVMVAAFIIALSSSVFAQGYGTGSNRNSHYVNPHVTKQGNFVPGHYRTNPNNTQFDNFGTKGNYNPYTGQFGKRPARY